MNPPIRFTVEVAAGDAMATEVLTRQLRVDLRALGKLSLEPVFAPMPMDPGLPPEASGAADHVGTVAASGVFTEAVVSGLFEQLVAFVHRTGAGCVTVRREDEELSVGGVTPANASAMLAELARLLRHRSG